MTQESQILQTPVLEIDKKLGPPCPRGRIERRVVWNLLHHLSLAGFQAVEVNDGEEVCPVGTPLEVMEEVFNLDEAHVYFRKRVNQDFPERKFHYVRFVFGNEGWDVVNDWSFTKRDPDGFNAAMEAFNAEDYV